MCALSRSSDDRLVVVCDIKYFLCGRMRLAKADLESVDDVSILYMGKCDVVGVFRMLCSLS